MGVRCALSCGPVKQKVKVCHHS